MVRLLAVFLSISILAACASGGGRHSSPAAKPRPTNAYNQIYQGMAKANAFDPAAAGIHFATADRMFENTLGNSSAAPDYFWNHWYLDHAYSVALTAQTDLELGLSALAREQFLEVPELLRRGQNRYRAMVRDYNETQQDIAMAMTFLTAGLGVAAAAQGVPANTVQNTMMPMFDMIEEISKPVDAALLTQGAPTNVEIDFVRLPAFFHYGPLSTIGRLYNGRSTCTAFFIRKRVVATNAHCITNDAGEYDIDWSTLRVEYRWLNDRNAMFNALPSETIYFDHAYVPASYSGTGDFEDDWALLVAKRPHPQGYFGWSTQRLEEDAEIAIAGHSSDLNQGRYITVDHGCRIRGNRAAYRYYCATFRGASGSPIIRLEPGGKNSNVVVGLHACSTRLTREESREAGRRSACGARLDQEFRDMLKTIEAAYPGAT